VELDEDKRIPFDTHYEHHMWVESEREAKARRSAWLSKLYGDVAKTIVLAVLGATGWLIVFGTEAKLKQVVKEVQVAEKAIKDD
jgi:hypothetical protein